MDIVGIGESDVDIYLQADEIPTFGSKVRAREIGRFAGGMIGNFCAGAAGHGMHCGLVSVVGDDENGKLVLQDYLKRDIDTSQVHIKKGANTFYCIVSINASGEKALSAVLTDAHAPELQDIDFSYIKRAKYAHINSMDYRLAKVMAEGLSGSTTKLSLDYEAHAELPGLESWRPIIEKTTLLFVNEDGLYSLCGDTPYPQAANQLLDLGVEMVVVTCAEKGGHVFSRQAHHSYRAYSAGKVVDTTGAGDCFNSAFLSMLIKNRTIAEAADYAAAAAALSLRHLGARTGLPSSSEVLRFLDTKPAIIQSNTI